MKRYLILLAAGILVSLLASSCIFIIEDTEGYIEIYNESGSGYNIVFINLRDAGTSTWGPDELGSDTLYEGESITITVSSGTYDVRIIDSAVFPEEDTYYAYDVYVAGGETVTLYYDCCSLVEY